MTAAVQAIPDQLLSVRGASDWLKRHGVTPHTRHAVLVAIASRKLEVAATMQRQFLVRESDLEKFAAGQQKAVSRVND